jgi:hypothetical protein
MKSFRNPFGSYLVGQVDRNDTIGNLARDFARFIDDGPHRITDYETAVTVRIWLNQRGATKFEHDALGKAERAWLDSMWAR